MTVPRKPEAARKKRKGYYYVWAAVQREYVRVRFMAGDGISTIATSNPWVWGHSTVESILRDAWKGDRRHL